MNRIALTLLGLLPFIGLSAQAQTVTWLTGTYVYDGAGNVKSIGATEQYRYDGLSRLVSGTVAAGRTQSATYDAFGNIKTLTTDGTSQALGVNSSTNRVAYAVDPVTNQPYNIFGTYDAAGRLTESSGGVGNAFIYDAGDMVTKSTVEGTTKVHLYTASDERIASVAFVGTVENGSEWTLRDPSGRILRRLEKTGTQWTWKEDYVYGGGQLLASEVSTPTQVQHFFPDHLGTPRLITANGGTKVAFHTYFPFGEEVTSWAQDNERVKFTGHERDAASVDYMHARYYGPKWGRFLSVDPTWDSANLSKPQSWNRYSYVMNNPVNATDPDGRVGFFLLPPTMPFHLGLNHPKSETVQRMEKAAVAVGLVALYVILTRGEAIFAPSAGEPELPPEPNGGQTTSPRVKKMSPNPEAVGPHTSFKKSAETDRVSGYETYDANGNPTVRFRGEGGPHGGVEPPVILEPKPGKGPGAKPIVPRKPEPDELPKGYTPDREQQ